MVQSLWAIDGEVVGDHWWKDAEEVGENMVFCSVVLLGGMLIRPISEGRGECCRGCKSAEALLASCPSEGCITSTTM